MLGTNNQYRHYQPQIYMDLVKEKTYIDGFELASNEGISAGNNYVVNRNRFPDCTAADYVDRREAIDFKNKSLFSLSNRIVYSNTRRWQHIWTVLFIISGLSLVGVGLTAISESYWAGYALANRITCTAVCGLSGSAMIILSLVIEKKIHDQDKNFSPLDKWKLEYFNYDEATKTLVRRPHLSRSGYPMSSQNIYAYGNLPHLAHLTPNN